MSRHVVVAFGGVDEHRVAVGNEAGEKGFEITANVWIGIFLNEERGGGVSEVQCQQTVLETLLREPIRDAVGDIVEASAAS